MTDVSPDSSLRVCVLAGGFRPTPVIAASGLSVLDLEPIRGVRIGDYLVNAGADLFPDGEPDVVFASGGRLPMPKDSTYGGVHVETVVDDGLRGPAGTVLDCAGGADRVLVIEANRVPLYPLRAIEQHHRSEVVPHGGAATIGVASDGTPGGVTLLDRRALKLIPPKGFFDLKEQLIERMREANLWVGALPIARSELVAVETVRDVVDLRERMLASGLADLGPAPTTDPSAVITDSVIGRDAVIGARAVIARSIVMPGAIVPPESVVVDAVHLAGARSKSRVRTGGRKSA